MIHVFSLNSVQKNKIREKNLWKNIKLLVELARGVKQTILIVRWGWISDFAVEGGNQTFAIVEWENVHFFLFVLFHLLSGSYAIQQRKMVVLSRPRHLHLRTTWDGMIHIILGWSGDKLVMYDVWLDVWYGHISCFKLSN